MARYVAGIRKATSEDMLSVLVISCKAKLLQASGQAVCPEACKSFAGISSCSDSEQSLIAHCRSQ